MVSLTLSGITEQGSVIGMPSNGLAAFILQAYPKGQRAVRTTLPPTCLFNVVSHDRERTFLRWLATPDLDFLKAVLGQLPLA